VLHECEGPAIAPASLLFGAMEWDAVRGTGHGRTALMGYEPETGETTAKAAAIKLGVCIPRDALRLAHGAVTREVIGGFLHVHNALGSGLAESVYGRALPIALERRSLTVTREKMLRVWYEGVVVGEFRADLMVDDCVLVELKAVEKLARIHEAQVYNYLRITKLPVGLLLNFGPTPQYRRIMLPEAKMRDE